MYLIYVSVYQSINKKHKRAFWNLWRCLFKIDYETVLNNIFSPFFIFFAIIQQHQTKISIYTGGQGLYFQICLLEVYWQEGKMLMGQCVGLIRERTGDPFHRFWVLAQYFADEDAKE